MNRFLVAAAVALNSTGVAHGQLKREAPEHLTCTYDDGGSFTLQLKKMLIRNTKASSGYKPGYKAYIIAPSGKDRTMKVDTNPEGPIVVFVLSAYHPDRGLEIQYKFVNKDGGWKFGHLAEDRLSQNNGTCKTEDEAAPHS